nr:hypothetical protein [Tanacetum cinerariifolium]
MKDGHMTPTGSKFISKKKGAKSCAIITSNGKVAGERNLPAQNLMIAVSRLQKVSQHAFAKLGMSRVLIVKQYGALLLMSLILECPC